MRLPGSISTLLQRLQPPEFPGDPVLTRAGQALARILWLILVLLLVLLPVQIQFTLRVGWAASVPGWVGLLTPMGVGSILLVLVYMRQVRLASWMAVWGFWMVTTLQVLASGGLESPAVASFVMSVVLAGFLISRRAALWVTGVTLLTVLAVWFADTQGWVPEAIIITTAASKLTVLVVGVVGTMALVLLALDSLNKSLAESQAYAARLERMMVEQAAAEQAVRDLNATLEQRVAERTAQLEVARQQAESANHLKSAFMAAMNHELRTPLNAIINFTQFVAAGYKGPVNGDQRDALGKVLSSSRHLLTLINDVLDLSKIEAGALQLVLESDVDLTAELYDMRDTALGLLGDKPVTVTVTIREPLPALTCDARRVHQILLNLVSNACKFTEAGAVAIEAETREAQVVIAVRDTGPGIAPEDHARIFEAFQQTSLGLTKTAGTGMGLAISQRLAEAHGGRLWVESAVGAGSVFYVGLPVDGQTPVAGRQSPVVGRG